MDDKVVSLADHRLDESEFAVSAGDDFLVEEGLDLLAAYRSISNKELRRSLRDLISQIAKSQVL